MLKYVRLGLHTLLLSSVLFISTSSAQFLMFENPLLGEKAPEFKLKLAGGKMTSFDKFRDGKRTIVFFWATWCPHCRVQLLEMNGQLDMFAEKNIKLATVDLGEKESIVQRYLKKTKIKAPVFLDTKNELEEAYQIMGVPTFFFVNSEGKITGIKHSLPENYEDFLNKKM